MVTPYRGDQREQGTYIVVSTHHENYKFLVEENYDFLRKVMEIPGNWYLEVTVQGKKLLLNKRNVILMGEEEIR